MKKLFLSVVMLVSSVVLFAQLPYDTKLTSDLFNDSRTVTYKTDNCKWELGAITLGPLATITKAENYCVIALPTVGIPQKVYFQYRALAAGTLTIYESSDHENWTGAWTKEVETKIVTAYKDSADLKASTRYLKIYFNSRTQAYVSEFSVSEKKSLSVNIDEYQFPNAMVDDAPAIKTVTVSWTNIVASVTSTNPVFTVSTTSIGEKNKENETTNLAISFNHAVYGAQEGEIIIEGEGRKATVKVTGTTSRYEQTLTWNQTLGTYTTTDNLHLNAYTNYSLPVSYISSDSTIAWVDSLGNVQVVCAGTVSFTAQQMGTYKYAPTTQITKQATFTKANPAVAVSAASIVYGQAIKDVVLTKVSGTVEGTLAFVDVDPDSVFNAGEYDLTVRFTPEDLCVYNEADRQVTLVVNKANQTIEWNQEQTSLYVDESLELTAKASSGLPMTYAFTNCNIDIDGNLMTGVEEGDVLVIAFQAGNENYYPSTVAMQAFEVLPKVTPTAERRVEVTLDELEQNGKKYYHNGEVYIYYRAHIYTAEGKVIK